MILQSEYETRNQQKKKEEEKKLNVFMNMMYFFMENGTIYQLILYLAIVIYSKTITTLSKYLYIIQNNQEVVEVIINVKCPIV